MDNSNKFDVSYLKFPMDEWGYTDVNNPEMVAPFKHIAGHIDPVSVIEIGMWAGHSTIVMLELFKNMEYLRTYDPNPVSKNNSIEIKKRYLQWDYVPEHIRWHSEKMNFSFPVPLPNRKIDLVFVDGNHTGDWPASDLDVVVNHIKPKYVLVDNFETQAVRMAVKKKGLLKPEFNPVYFFYTNLHKGNITPGIMGLYEFNDSIISS